MYFTVYLRWIAGGADRRLAQFNTIEEALELAAKLTSPMDDSGQCEPLRDTFSVVIFNHDNQEVDDNGRPYPLPPLPTWQR